MKKHAHKTRPAKLRPAKLQVDAELDLLRALCNGRGTRERTIALVQALASYRFTEAEHQIVFESARDLLTRHALSVATLVLHLNNRGFPDLNLEKYFVAMPPNIEDGWAGILEFLPSSV